MVCVRDISVGIFVRHWEVLLMFWCEASVVIVYLIFMSGIVGSFVTAVLHSREENKQLSVAIIATVAGILLIVAGVLLLVSVSYAGGCR